MKLNTFVLLLSFLWVSSSFGQSYDKEAIAFIRKEGLEKSQVMEIASMMTDVYGPRMTGSPMLDKATVWAQDQLKQWSMSQVHTEQWGPFGRGWEMKSFHMHCVEPSYWPIIAYPKAWSPSVGNVSGKVIYLNATTVEELAAYKGKLKGHFVLMDTARVLKEWMDPLAKRLTDKELLEKAQALKPAPRVFRGWDGQRSEFSTALWKMLHEEKPLALIDRSYKGDLGTVFVAGARAKEGQARDKDAEVLPQLTMSVEHYNRIFRLLDKGLPVTLKMNLEATYTNPDGMEHNIIADIPGTDLKDEVVMFGAHFDSWHTGTGATDNGAGSAVMMEAARILQALIKETGKQPRRTLRLALWTGEEQGLFGSLAYVADHLAEVDPYGNLLTAKPDNEKVSAYYNLDNGTGKIRGIYLQGNEAVAPIFRNWLDEFKDLEANTLTLENTGGTDHLAFDRVGVPGFQFIQEPLAYWSRTHHSNMDNWDHLVGDDLKQAATIIAAFVWNTAQMDEKLPRKPIVSGDEEAEGK